MSIPPCCFFIQNTQITTGVLLNTVPCAFDKSPSHASKRGKNRTTILISPFHRPPDTSINTECRAPRRFLAMFRSLVTPSSTSQSQVGQSSPAEVVPKGFRLFELPRKVNLPYWPAAHCRLEFAHCLAGKGITGDVRLVIDALDILPCSRVEG